MRQQQTVEAGQVIRTLGDSGFGSGFHLHLHVMDGPDLLTTLPLPIALRAEGHVYASQAGEIITQ
ncbi:MAG: M23 family metallopeptidase [Roseiflexus sp.]|nr:M23 family metallopeptidase [Roseiflexus sp.]